MTRTTATKLESMLNNYVVSCYDISYLFLKVRKTRQ